MEAPFLHLPGPKDLDASLMSGFLMLSSSLSSFLLNRSRVRPPPAISSASSLVQLSIISHPGYSIIFSLASLLKYYLYCSLAMWACSFMHNWDKSRTYLIRFLWVINKLVWVKHLEWLIVCRSYIITSCHYCCPQNPSLWFPSKITLQSRMTTKATATFLAAGWKESF